MGDRSLKATAAGIEIAKIALTTKKLTQEKLMELVDVQSRSTISNFFTGKPVDRQIFVTICEKLEINWQEISRQLPSQSGKGTESESIDIEALVKLARERCAGDIQKRCGTMRVLDMEQPVALSDIYTDVNILEKITRNQRKDLEELRAVCGIEEFDRWGLSGIKQKRVEGIEAVRNHSKLMILGKPGAGKTTFLKFLAMSCISGKAFTDFIPVFVTLKDFADRENRPSLLQFLTGEFSQWDIEVEPILKSGRALVLLDGLDEVRAEYDDRALREIREFARNYSESKVVVTCRIATKEYTFEQFTDVEIADFDERQIATFSGNWFCKKEIKSEDFLAKLEQNNRVQQLATSPLLLTLLCLAFEESGKFSANRSELYKEGLDALLRKWDSKRRIRRDSVYQNLSVQKKEDMLSQIALAAFERGDYFVKQRQLEDYICDFIRNTANAKTDDEELQLDSEAVLKSIEAQHGLFVERARGIYSFSHLTFHEYFAARQIVVSTSPSKLEAALQNLVTHITDKRWREVILLSVGMAREADDLLLLMKRKIDSLLADDEKLQGFLAWADEKSRSLETEYTLLDVRAYCFTIPINLNLYPTIEIDSNLAIQRYQDDKFFLNLDPALIDSLEKALDIEKTIDRALELACEKIMDFAINLGLNLALSLNFDKYFNLALNKAIEFVKEIAGDTLYRHLQDLKYSLPDSNQDEAEWKKWWKISGKEWISEFRQVLIEHRNIGHDWQLTKEQRDKLKQYYEANQLLVECLKSDCYVRRETRQEIEESLLLPSVSSKR